MKATAVGHSAKSQQRSNLGSREKPKIVDTGKKILKLNTAAKVITAIKKDKEQQTVMINIQTVGTLNQMQ